jgi:mono/diheme cytochrome c family protein
VRVVFWLLAGALAGCVVGCASSASSHTAASRVGVVPHGERPTVTIPPPPDVVRADGRRLAEFKRGRVVVVETGCLACHRLGAEGHSRPGRNLTHIGSVLSARQIERAIVRGRRPMPSFAHLPKAKLHALVTFLSLLR